MVEEKNPERTPDEDEDFSVMGMFNIDNIERRRQEREEHRQKAISEFNKAMQEAKKMQPKDIDFNNIETDD